MENASHRNYHVDSIPAGIPVVTICGFSNSGKTTLIENIIPHCIEDGLRVAVMKFYQRSFQLDTHGKDTYRFFEAGATVFGHDSGQRFVRRHSFGDETIFSDILNLAKDHDLIIIEGHKHISHPGKIWLRRHPNDEPPPETLPVLTELGMDDDRCSKALAIIRQEVACQHLKRPLHVGLFVGSAEGETLHKPIFSKVAHQDFITSGGETLQTPKIHLFAADNDLIKNIDYTDIVSCTQATSFLSATQIALNSYPHSKWLLIDANSLPLKPNTVRDMVRPANPGVWCVLPDKHINTQSPGIIWIDTRAGRILEISEDFTSLAQHPKTRCLP